VFEQVFKNIDDVLWKEAGCTTELDYTEQTSWLLFLKYLDDLEKDKSAEAALAGRKYAYIFDRPYRWETWAAPKGRDGKLDQFLHWIYVSDVTEGMQSHSTGIRNLNTDAYKAIDIQYPSISEQRRIVATLDALQKETQRLAGVYEKKLAALEELKTSLLHHAFTGNL
jgi:hypothetical protein